MLLNKLNLLTDSQQQTWRET